MKVARSEGMKLLQMLHVSEKRNVLSDKLSGGMKRKLSLAIALIGSPKVTDSHLQLKFNLVKGFHIFSPLKELEVRIRDT